MDFCNNSNGKFIWCRLQHKTIIEQNSSYGQEAKNKEIRHNLSQLYMGRQQLLCWTLEVGDDRKLKLLSAAKQRGLQPRMDKIEA